MRTETHMLDSFTRIDRTDRASITSKMVTITRVIFQMVLNMAMAILNQTRDKFSKANLGMTRGQGMENFPNPVAQSIEGILKTTFSMGMAK